MTLLALLACNGDVEESVESAVDMTIMLNPTHAVAVCRGWTSEDAVVSAEGELFIPSMVDDAIVTPVPPGSTSGQLLDAGLQPLADLTWAPASKGHRTECALTHRH